MTLHDYIIAFLVTVPLVFGGYFIYFLPQKYGRLKPREFNHVIDLIIPFKPEWVWIYIILFHIFIVSWVFIVQDMRHFVYIVASILVMLFIQVLIGFFFPVKTPNIWRLYEINGSLSKKFLSFVQHIDKGGNCFPSMHVGVSVLVSLHIVEVLINHYGVVAYAVHFIPLIISASTVFTKQHYFVDIFGGFLIAILSYLFFTTLY